MLEARKASIWRSRYDITIDGHQITTWDGTSWRSGGDFELAGYHYKVRSNAWGNQFEMVDTQGTVLASADQVGRKQWTVTAAGQTYQFQRVSMWNDEQELRVGDTRVGSVRRTSVWRGDIAADLPGLPLPVQVFVVGVVISMWEAQAAAAG